MIHLRELSDTLQWLKGHAPQLNLLALDEDSGDMDCEMGDGGWIAAFHPVAEGYELTAVDDFTLDAPVMFLAGCDVAARLDSFRA